jgi:glycosyltransferase involved in cell wall biosynthesis
MKNIPVTIKKIYIIGSAGIPARYGGFETYAENIALKLAKNYQIYVVCSKKFFSKKANNRYTGMHIKLLYLPLNANGTFSIFYDLISLVMAALKSDFIIMLGSGAGIFLPFCYLFRKVRIATHIDGLEWKRKKWNKLVQLYLYINNNLSIRYSRYILIDNKVLLGQIPDKFRKKILLTTYGGEHLPKLDRNQLTDQGNYALVIARAEPENNIHVFLEAFERTELLNLVVISNWENTSYGRSLYKKYHHSHRIKLCGPIYENLKKIQEFRQGCKMYLHGHSAGATNPSLIEAMYSMVPIIAYNNGFNRVTTNECAEYFSTADELTDKIRYVINEDLSANVMQMYEYAKRNYTWEKAAEEILKVIE